MSDKYPEHEKLKLISGKSQAIGEFLDWLEGGLATTTSRRSVGLAWVPPGESLIRWYHVPKTRLLAEFFDIDHERLEDEKMAILESIRQEDD